MKTRPTSSVKPPASKPPTSKPPTSKPRIPVIRYTLPARLNHSVTAVSFMLLTLSGLAFFHPSLYFLTMLFGGGELARLLHPWIGVVLAVSFAGLFLRFWRDNRWRAEDGAWIGSLRQVLSGHEENLPEIGKYNAGQKFVFWGMAVFVLGLLGSGILIWEQYFGTLTPVDTQRVAVLVHSALAILGILVLVVHIYAAIWVRSTIGAMSKGTVTAGWAWRHHRKWLREEAAKGLRPRT